jgi:type IV secretory pathway VirB9-like protein
MNKTFGFIAALYVSGSMFLLAGPASPDSLRAAKKPEEVLPVPISATDETPPIVARTVTYGQKDVVAVRTKLRYTTLIILPKTENILDYTCGDKDYWVVNGSNNFAYVKPAKAGAQTNLNLVTASGNIYSFVLSEVSELPKTVPDLKVFVELKDEAMMAAARVAPRFVPTQELDSYKEQLDRAKVEAQQAKDAQAAAIQQGVNRVIANMRFPYAFEAGKKPFFVRAMYHDDRFTYIQARPEETPTLYEIKDGQPNLINFTYKDGLYTVDKILDRGYLAIGKQKLVFTREE